MKNPIDNTVFDSRDLIEYKEYLESEIYDAYVEWVESHNENSEAEELEIPESFDEIEFLDEEAFTTTCEDLIEEYESIKGFCEELEGYGDLEHGETLIHEDYFTEYSKELCEDIGAIPRDLPGYIECNIDWDGVADGLKVDYMSVDYNGDTYYMRA